MRFGIVVFPGSNCDHDAYHAIKHVLGQPAEFLWHKDRDLKDVDAIILPGGFSYGDYLRCGAMAARSPVMEEVVAFARRGGPVMGICNGFQILLETGLLPGAMLRNRSLKFVCQDTWLKVENPRTRFTRRARTDAPLHIPIAHAEGNYFLDDDGLQALHDRGQIVLRYTDARGQVTDEANPNGARENIAGIVNEAGNVLGLMPHPERACEAILGSSDGLGIFESMLE